MGGLLDYVKALEGQSNKARGEQVLSFLKELGIEAATQGSRLLGLRNIIVDLPPGPGMKRLLFSAHYDAYPGSPGANDNASGVAVLLGLCQEQREERVPIRVVFFDREEAWLRTPLLRLGLLGSLYFTCRNDLHDFVAVYNLEFCGLGDYLGLWPVSQKEKELPAVKAVRRVATRFGIPCGETHMSWYVISSDHLSFRLKGFANALTLSLLPSTQISLIEEGLTQAKGLKLLRGRRPQLPEPLSFIHTPEDTSARLNEDSLALMLSVLLGLCEENAAYALC